ncbi:hypothetical protein CYMTET_22759 [Cymbomonas tetramitiformis]|uniref:Uncharacterized protein n=1 Tax=Cymbomonas tetramitiformis TaxID=36881 RepID=A0AAE0L1T1_9CHLO|nr:hypothetical protein CYMTET_22759 [Cymbomonas tetramitiformis]
MDTSLLIPQLVSLGVIAISVGYWWFVLVPSARVRLAVNKKNGSLKNYLTELKADDSRPLEKWFYSQWLEKVDPETRYLLREDEETNSKETEPVAEASLQEKLELDEVIRQAKRTPKFWSGDNPVLVGTGLSIGAAALFGSLGNLL